MMVPRSRPQLKKEDALQYIAHINRKKYPLVILGIRGYYRDTMGVPGTNDIGLYDDALFLHYVKDGTEYYGAFNGNTDPSRQRDGMATLKPGTWYAHCIGPHKAYIALAQRMGKVTVLRHKPGNVPIEDTGVFGINIHKGGYTTTSSEGCQTIHPDQWVEFIKKVIECMTAAFGSASRERTIPYVLVEQQ